MYYTLRGFGWCFSMCFPNFWLDVYILSQSLQSNFPMSILWVRLCCVRYLFCVNAFSHVPQLNIITVMTAIFFFTMSPPQFNWCFCKLSFRVYTFSHFSHSNLLSKWVFMCLASSPFATNVALFNCVDISNVLLQNICCVELSFTDVTVGLVFWVVFSVVLVETKSTDEFFSTISTLILNVHGSKSRSQLKSSTIFKTVSTFDFWQTLTLHLIQIPSSTFYSFSTFWSSVN